MSSKHHSQIRSGACAAKRDNFVAAVVNTNENVSATCQREIYGGLKIINYAKRYRRDRLRLVANGSCQHAQTRLGWRCWSLCMTNSKESSSVLVVAVLIAISVVVPKDSS